MAGEGSAKAEADSTAAAAAERLRKDRTTDQRGQARPSVTARLSDERKNPNLVEGAAAG